MALIRCKECGKEFSDMADACPNCGYSPAREQKKKLESNLVHECERKSKITAGFLCLFLWCFGAHQFYLGNIGAAIGWIILSAIASVFTMVLPIFGLLILVPIICAVKLWSMPQDAFDKKYNQTDSPKSSWGCLFGAIIGVILLGFFSGIFLAGIVLPAFNKAVAESRMRQMSNIVDTTKNQLSNELDNM